MKFKILTNQGPPARYSTLSGHDYSKHQQRHCHTRLSIFLLSVVCSLFPLLSSHPQTSPDHSFLLAVIFPRKCYIYRDKSLSYGFGKTGTWVTVWESNGVTLPTIVWICTWMEKIKKTVQKQLLLQLNCRKNDTTWACGQTWNGKSMSQSTAGSFCSNGNRISGVEEDECWRGGWQPVVVRQRDEDDEGPALKVSSGTQVKRDVTDLISVNGAKGGLLQHHNLIH